MIVIMCEEIETIKKNIDIFMNYNKLGCFFQPKLFKLQQKCI